MKKPKFTDNLFEVLVDDPNGMGGVPVKQPKLAETPVMGAEFSAVWY